MLSSLFIGFIFITAWAVNHRKFFWSTAIQINATKFLILEVSHYVMEP